MKSISEGHEKDSVVVITEAKDNEGYNVIVPIRLSVNENENKKGHKEYLINEIMSIHGRSNIDYVFSETLRQKGILKIDKNKMQDLHKFTTQLQDVAVVSPANNSITDYTENFNPNENNNKGKTLFQDANDEEDEKLIAGFTYPEVLDKLTELYDILRDDKKKLSEEEEKKLWAKVHVLEDAFEIAENPEKFSNEDRRHEVMLNAYYVMNNQEIPEDYIETDSKSKRTYND